MRSDLNSSVLLVVVVLSGFAGLADAAPMTLRFSGQLEDVISAGDPRFPPEETQSWTDLSGLQPETPWRLTVTYDADAAGVEFAPAWNGWSYSNAVLNADLVLGPYAYTASEGDVFTNAGLPYGVGYDDVIAGRGQVQFQFATGVWSGLPGAPPVWDGNMLVSYNDNGAMSGALPRFLDMAAYQGLQSHLLWEQLPADQGGAQFFSPHGQIAVEQVTAVPEPATWLLLGGGMSAVLARHLRGRRR